jgi:DNA-binding XRE family transcriptional regulator
VEHFSGPELQRKRELAGLTRTKLAAGIDRSEQSVKAYERGAALPSVRIVAALADVLGCDAGDLFVSDAEPARA